MAPRSLEYVKCAQGMLAKSDGRDKLLALLQYAAMFAAAGTAGRALKVQRNLGAARKPFRLLKVRRRPPRCGQPSTLAARAVARGVCAAQLAHGACGACALLTRRLVRKRSRSRRCCRSSPRRWARSRR